MQDLTTYEFYKNIYFGDTIEESAFPKWLSKATDKLERLTYGNITEESLLAYNIQIQKAVCALIDLLYELEKALKEANTADEANVKSKSSGGESVTYKTSETLVTKVLSDRVAQNRLAQDIIKEYLTDTRLLYAGV